MTAGNKELMELKADCERLRKSDLENVRSLVRYMLECYDIAKRQVHPQLVATDDDQKDLEEYIEEMSFGGRTYKIPR
jgi:hypothetical protein